MSSTPEPPLASVDEVREQLRQLGYLDSGLDRFVLDGAPATLPPARAALRVAVRVGLAGGALLSAALTAAAASLDPALRSAPLDLLVLAAWVSVPSALAVGALVALVGLGAAAAARRGRTPGPGVSRVVGLGVALPALLYLGFWWRSHAVEAGVLFQVTSTVLGLLLVLALGRLGAAAAVAVLSAAGAAGSLPRAPTSRRWQAWMLAAAALGVGVLVLAVTWNVREPGVAPDFAVVPTGLRVRVVAIDGLGRDLAVQRMGAGAMPALASLLRRSAWGPLAAEPQPVPLIVWTSIATGEGPEAHGVVSVGARRLAGMSTGVAVDEESRVARVLASTADLLRLTRSEAPSAERNALKTFWNVASDKGLSVGVVNWWATWPAEPLVGWIVTDRALLRLDAGGAPEQEVHPPELLDRLRGLVPPPAAGESAVAREAARAHRIDAFHLAAARQMRAPSPPELEVLYLPGLDILSAQALDDPGGLDVAALGQRLAAVYEHCRFLDAALREIVDSLAPQDVLVLVADPGRVGRRGPGAPEGLVAITGPFVAQRDIGVVSARDIAPTVLHLLGLPVSRELDGRVLTGAFTMPFLDANPVREVETYGRRARGPRPESAFDEEVLEQLRSLGYIR